MLKSVLTALAIARGKLSAFQPESYRADLLPFRLFGKHQIVVNRPGLVRRVMLDGDGAFPKHPALIDTLGPLVGNGVFVSHGEHWEASRQAFDSWLDGSALRLFHGHMQAATNDLLLRLQKAPGAEISLEREMTHVTADIIHRSIFQHPITPSMLHAVDTSFATFRRASQALFPSLLMNIPSLRGPLLRRSLRNSGAHIREATAESLQTYKEAVDKDSGLLSHLQEARVKRGFALLSDPELIDEVVVVLLAGHETSAAALTWTFLMLAEHPDWQSKIHEELAALPSDEPVSLRDLSKLTTLRNTFRETLRLMPPIPMFPRIADQPCQFAGRQYPKGTSVMVCPWLIHRREGTWTNADKFDPYRFQASAQKQAVSKAFLPFGLGPRACPGAGFALQEATVVLAEVLKRYHVAARFSRPLQPHSDLTLRPPTDLSFTLKKRSVNASWD